jgi:hypothetical protein
MVLVIPTYRNSLNRRLKYITTSKSKAVPLYAMEALGVERRYSSYSFTTSALDGVSGHNQAPDALYPRGKDTR